MAILYSLSDPHGEIEVFKETLGIVDLRDKKNKLVLLGDYIDHQQKKFELLYFIKDLQEQYKNQIIVLAGNHEYFLLEDIQNKSIFFDDDAMINWLKALPFHFETDSQIYVHAGIDEEAGEFWKWGSEDYYFCSKYPYTIGKFEKDIIAGHIGTSTITGDENYHKVFWDKQSHFYIDGTTELSKILPLLKYDTNTKRYSSFEKVTDENGLVRWVEYTIK